MPVYTFEQCSDIIAQTLNNPAHLNREPFGLYEPILYTFSTGGKYIRSSLALLACNLFSDKIDQALYPAIALEAFHNFTLIHDDIMDDAPIRRGKPTVHMKWSANTALLSGDAMHVLACQYMLRAPGTVLQPVLQMFHKTAMEVCEGQQWDMDFEHADYISIDEYLRMIELKTSVLLACSLYIGGLCGGGDQIQCDWLYQFGRNLGLAFQIQDDLLDVYADPAVFGKATGGDIVANKKTFLLITAMNKADEAMRLRLHRAMSTYFPTPEEKIAEVTAIYDTLHIREDAEKEIERYFNFALDALDKVEVDAPRKEEIRKLALRLMKRQK